MHKAFDNIKHSFVEKALKKLGIEGLHFNIIKAMYENPTGNIILNGKILKTGTQVCPLAQLSI
jgi:hypothetical protein